MFVIDSHCDTPSQIHRLRDLSSDEPHSQVDFPKLRRGGVDAAFFALYTPAAMSPADATGYAMQLLEEVRNTVASNSSVAALATSPSEAISCKEAGRFAVCLGMENGSPIQKSLHLLREFFSDGVRYMTLCHSMDNLICDSCAQGNTWNGLSPFGREVVREMNRLGMMVDVSHISDRSFYDVIDCSQSPVVATHSCCRALADHPRNLTDDMLRKLADSGGVVQINFFPVFLDDGFAGVLAGSGLYEKGEHIEADFIADPSDPEKKRLWFSVLDELSSLPRPSYRRIADHIDHAVEVAGIDHVGLGSDFDGIEVTPDGMENAGCFYRIFEELRLRGYGDGDIEKIAGGNFLRVWNMHSSVLSDGQPLL